MRKKFSTRNVIQNKNFSFPKILYKIRKECRKKSCSSQKHIQIYLRPFFHRTHGFRSNSKKNVIEND